MISKSERASHAAETAERSRSVPRATFSAAMRAWFAGDFEECLALCDRVRPPDVDTISQLALLRARASLRLGRPDAAIAAVNAAFVSHGTLDASLSARMLLGAAHVRRGDLQHGLDLLEAAQRASADAHPTIRSEIALNIALARYGLRLLDDAERALDLVSADADIVHARALEFRGWIAVARADYAPAVEQFRAALERLDRCRHADRFLEANALKALAILAAERLDRSTWLIVEQRAERMRWDAAGLADARFAIAISGSMYAEAQGRVDEALRWCAEADDAAPTEPARLYAACRRAAVLREVGERFAHRDAVDRIVRGLERLDDRALRDDDRQVLLAVAPELTALGRVAEARAALARYDALEPRSTMLALADDPRSGAFRAHVCAAIADASGDPRGAHAHYRDAFRTFHRIGYHRRALLAALRLGELSGQQYLLAYVERTLGVLGAASPLRARAQRGAWRPPDPVVELLSPPERAVLDLVCSGKSTAQIAEARGRSKQTIRNTISRLLGTFEVPDRQALLHECVKRGLLG